MVQLNPKITASFTFHGTEMKDVEVINPGDWFGKTWLLGISCGFDTDFYIVEADSACDAIDELIDSGKGDALLIDEAQFGEYGVATDNPTCSFAGNDGRPVDLEWLSIHGDDRTGFECLYHVEGWGAPVKPKDLSDVLEKMETVAQWREDTKRPGKFQACEAYAAYYWHSHSDEDIEDRFGNLISRYEVTAEDRLMFPELANVATVYLRETEDGFVVESDEPEQYEGPTFSVIEYSSHFAVRHNATEREESMGDGVDTLFDADGVPLTPGTEGFIAAWEASLNEDEDETLRAYFSDLS